MADNLFETVDRLDRLISRLELAIYGDPAAQTSGLLATLKDQQVKVAEHDRRIEQLESIKPNPAMWIGGFAAFLVAMFFAMIATRQLSEIAFFYLIPTSAAASFTVVAAGVSLGLFMRGFGWVRIR